MNVTDLNPEELRSVFSAIGLCNKEGRQYFHRLGKHRQIFDFILHMEKAARQLSTKRILRFVDCACGRSYLSFVANYWLTRVLDKKIEFTCIDYNRHVIERSKEAAEALGFDNMRFICDDISRVKLVHTPDIIFSLHACNTATDMTIAKGIKERAKFIMTVSCCQYFIRSQMKKHPLTAITSHSAYKERVADMLADTMRSLILEETGYRVDLFEYVPARETPKNIMLRAVRTAYNEKKAAQANDAYIKLKEAFNAEPRLINFLK